MRVLVYSTKPYDREFLGKAADATRHELAFLETRLTVETAALADGHDAVCAFVNDDLGRSTLQRLAEGGVRAVALRCAGFNNVDLKAAAECGVRVVRVPAYSPHAVAEHAVGLILALNRNLHRAYHRVRDGNFALDGLLGFDMRGRTVGVVGTGQIGYEFARIMRGFGCDLLAFDLVKNPACVDLGVRYVDLPALLAESDIVSLHCPLTPVTHHLIDAAALAKMKPGVMLINTSRGAVVDTAAVIDALKSRHLGWLGLDVYEEEADFFFEDLSNNVLTDDTLARLLTFPNVLVTGHQAFFTREALTTIAETTLESLSAIETGEPCANEVGGAA